MKARPAPSRGSAHKDESAHRRRSAERSSPTARRAPTPHLAAEPQEKAHRQNAEALSVSSTLSGATFNLAPPPVSAGGVDIGQRLWEWGRQANEAGQDTLAGLHQWAGQVFKAQGLKSQGAGLSNDEVTQAPLEAQPKANSQGTKLSAIEILMSKELKRRTNNSRTRQLGDDSLGLLRVQVKQNPNLLLEALNGLNNKSPHSLTMAVRLLAAATKVKLIREDGTYHLMGGSSLEALGLGSRALQERIEELGPIAEVYLSQNAHQPSFRYDLRQQYSPNEALTEKQLQSLPEPQSNDTLAFFSQNTALLEDLMRGLSSDEWPNAVPYFANGIERRTLQKKVAGHADKAEYLVKMLMAPDGLRWDHRLALILRELMGQPMGELQSFKDVHIDSIRRLTTRAISHLNDSLTTPAEISTTPAPTALQLETAERKKRARQYSLELENRALNGLVDHSLFPSIKAARTALNRGLTWVNANWAPRNKQTIQLRGPMKTASSFNLLYFPEERSPNGSTPYQRIHLTPQTYQAILRFIRTPGQEWTHSETSHLYALLKGVGHLMEITDISGKKHLVRTSDVFHALFNEWKLNQQLAVEVELFESGQGDAAVAHQKGLNALAQAIRKGMAKLSQPTA